MTKAIENLFIYVSAGSDLAIILFFLAYIKKVRRATGLWMIVIYCATSLISNYIDDNYLTEKYEYIFYYLFTLLEYLIFSSFLYLSISSPGFRKLIIGMSVVFMIFAIGYLTFVPPHKIDSVSIGIETILIILYSFWFLYEQMNNTSNLFIYNKYEFWVITGLLIYLAGSFFIYIYANQMDHKFLINYWYLTNVFYIIKNLFFGLAIYNLIRKKQNNNFTSNKSFHPHFL
jgi:hypothetical protein